MITASSGATFAANLAGESASEEKTKDCTIRIRVTVNSANPEMFTLPAKAAYFPKKHHNLKGTLYESCLHLQKKANELNSNTSRSRSALETLTRKKFKRKYSAN
mmetsp:Transcript_5347/g.9816  ORF Transcript_5347/g.9816 Transcript_5347/m.9816 type:complete len:104 (-) Transcript_5347:54-365(-)